MPDQSPDFRTVHLTVSVPASTLAAAPQKTSVDLGAVTIVEAQLIIPRGHNGLTGVALVYDGQGLVPWATPPTFLVSDDEKTHFDVDFAVGHALAVWSYNIGAYDHSFYWRFKVRDAVLDQPTAPAEPFMVVSDL